MRSPKAQPQSQPTPPSKLFYRIGELSRITGLEPYVLRYWETEFPHLRPEKRKSGQRLYTKKDLGNIIQVKELLYQQGFTIAGAKKKLRRKSGRDSSEVVERVAREIRDLIDILK